MEKRITAADLRAGKKLCGAWAHLGSNLSAEILAKAGYDVIIPDMEHAPYSLPALVSVLQAVESSGCFTMVRAPWNDQVAIKQILDCGADGIHIPYVNTRQEAEYAVRACKYPPPRRPGGGHQPAGHLLRHGENGLPHPSQPGCGGHAGHRDPGGRGQH